MYTKKMKIFWFLQIRLRAAYDCDKSRMRLASRDLVTPVIEH
jgi:hypothetical protein